MLVSRIPEIVSLCNRGRECATTVQDRLEFSILCRGIALINETIWLPEMLFGAACGSAACAQWKRAERHRPNTLEIDSHTARDLSQNTQFEATIKGESESSKKCRMQAQVRYKELWNYPFLVIKKSCFSLPPPFSLYSPFFRIN